jgi:hypothetical protein
MGWLLSDLVIGLIVLLLYHWIPLAYRPTIRNVRWVLLPYVALLSGGISPRFMGLTGINWLTSFGLGLGLIAAVLGLLVMIRSTTDFSKVDVVMAAHESSAAPLNNTRPRRYTPFSLAPLFTAGAEEFHWSFLRGTLWEILQSAPVPIDQTAYWAIWLAAIVALPEIFRFQTTMLARLFKTILLLLTTILFIYTQNFWLCWLLHGLVLLLLTP